MTRHETRESAFMLVFERALTGEDIGEILEAASETDAVKLSDTVAAIFKGKQTADRQMH